MKIVVEFADLRPGDKILATGLWPLDPPAEVDSERKMIMPELDLKMIAHDIAEILSGDHEIDVDFGDILPHLTAFLEKVAPGVISDTEGSPRRPFKTSGRQRADEEWAAAEHAREVLNCLEAQGLEADVFRDGLVSLSASDLRLLVQGQSTYSIAPSVSTERQRAADRVGEFLDQHDQLRSGHREDWVAEIASYTKRVVLKASDLRLLVQSVRHDPEVGSK